MELKLELELKCSKFSGFELELELKLELKLELELKCSKFNGMSLPKGFWHWNSIAKRVLAMKVHCQNPFRNGISLPNFQKNRKFSKKLKFSKILEA